jgi:CheY-like chemotaxis protein
VGPRWQGAISIACGVTGVDPVVRPPHARAAIMNIESVVLIDDEEDIRTIAGLSLRRVGGWAVFAAASGPDGVAEARRAAPDVILLDVMMPGCDGPTTFQMLRDDPATARIPVIFMTAKAQQREIDALLAMGAEGLIVKPFDPMQLPTQIRQILAARPAGS